MYDQSIVLQKYCITKVNRDVQKQTKMYDQIVLQKHYDQCIALQT